MGCMEELSHPGDICRINQSWEKLQEDDYLGQQVQFCYYNDQWEKVGETVWMTYGEFKIFLDYFTDMYYGKSMEEQE